MWDNRCRPVCSACHRKMAIRKKTRQRALDMPICATQATYVDYDAVQGYCRSCNRYETTRPLEIPENGKATMRFMRFVSSICRCVPASRVPEILGVSGASAWRYDRFILATELPEPCLDGVDALLIDEKHLGKARGFVTVVLNARNGELLHLGEGRSHESLDPFFGKMSQQQKAAIKAVGIDRSNAYRSAVRKHLANAQIVYDKFHIISNYNDKVVDAVRRRSLAQANAGEKRFITGQRYNLFRNPENLTPDGRRELSSLLEANAEIEAAYVLKDHLKVLWHYSYEKCAGRALKSWAAIAMATGVSELKRFAKSLLKAKDGILAYCKHRITSGKIEAFNRKIQRVLYKTCGVSNMQYLFLKLRQESL